MATKLFRMTQDGPRIAQDALRMFQGLPQDAIRMAPGLRRMAQDGIRIAQDASECLRIALGCNQDGLRIAQDGLGWPQDYEGCTQNV